MYCHLSVFLSSFFSFFSLSSSCIFPPFSDNLFDTSSNLHFSRWGIRCKRLEGNSSSVNLSIRRLTALWKGTTLKSSTKSLCIVFFGGFSQSILFTNRSFLCGTMNQDRDHKIQRNSRYELSMKYQPPPPPPQKKVFITNAFLSLFSLSLSLVLFLCVLFIILRVEAG